MAEISDRWFVIINPVAGAGHGLEDFPQIEKQLRNNHIVHDSVFTEHKSHAVELTVKAVNDGYRRIIVVGGDGTFNEVVNGLYIQKTCSPTDVLLAVVAAGTGNDWIRMFGIPRNYGSAIKAIAQGNSFLQDVGKIRFTEAQYQQDRYMANVAGLGFDALVISIYNHLKLKGKSGGWLYPFSIIKGYFSYKSKGVQIEADNRTVYRNLLFSLAIGICKYNGGGLQQLPSAVANDGLLDMTIIKPIHWWNIIFRLRKLVNGEIYDIGHVMHFQAKKIHIESAPAILLETDGELQGETPIDIEIIPNGIRVVVTSEFLEKEMHKNSPKA